MTMFVTTLLTDARDYTLEREIFSSGSVSYSVYITNRNKYVEIRKLTLTSYERFKRLSEMNHDAPRHTAYRDDKGVYYIQTRTRTVIQHEHKYEHELTVNDVLKDRYFKPNEVILYDEQNFLLGKYPLNQYELDIACIKHGGILKIQFFSGQIARNSFYRFYVQKIN